MTKENFALVPGCTRLIFHLIPFPACSCGRSTSVWSVLSLDIVHRPVFSSCKVCSGQFNTDVEVIVGTCKDEGLGQFIAAWSDPEFFDNLRTNWDTVGVATVLGLTRVSDVTPEDVEDARNLLEFYVGGVENMTMDNVQSLVDMMTDSSFLYGVHKKIGYLLRQNVTVYQYVLTHRGEFSITQMNGPSETVGNV